MKALLGLVAAAAALTLSGQALAADPAGLALAKKSDCLACHAEDKLVAKVKAGGSGVWGPVPMSAHPNLSDADLHTLVKWVLSH